MNLIKGIKEGILTTEELSDEGIRCVIKELIDEVEILEKTNDSLAEGILKLTSDKGNTDVMLTRKAFLSVYGIAFKQNVDGYDSPVYGKDVTVHWNGIYCNCEDGATAYNYIIDNIRWLDEELGGE